MNTALMVHCVVVVVVVFVVVVVVFVVVVVVVVVSHESISQFKIPIPFYISSVELN